MPREAHIIIFGEDYESEEHLLCDLKAHAAREVGRWDEKRLRAIVEEMLTCRMLCALTARRPEMVAKLMPSMSPSLAGFIADLTDSFFAGGHVKMDPMFFRHARPDSMEDEEGGRHE